MCQGGYDWCDWMADYYRRLCRDAKDCPAPDAALLAEWASSKREGIAEKVSELQGKLDEEQDRLDGLRS